MIIIEAIKWFALVWVLLSLIQSAAFRLSIYTKWFQIFEDPCRKCYTFWIVLFCTLNPFIAAIAAFFAMLESNYNTVRL